LHEINYFSPKELFIIKKIISSTLTILSLTQINFPEKLMDKKAKIFGKLNN